MEKPFAPACERNQDAILKAFQNFYGDEAKLIFEVGSGTGQHALYMANNMKSVKWITSDLEENHQGIKMWMEGSVHGNIQGPKHFKIGGTTDFEKHCDVVFLANVIHIMSWKECKTLFKYLGRNLKKAAEVLFYGPFNYDGQFTSEGNRSLDAWLKETYPGSGIRSFEDVSAQMEKNGLSLVEDYEMPANNRVLRFKKN